MRPEIAWFAEQMSGKLDENAHKGGWNRCDPWWLLGRLREEAAELQAAMMNPGAPEVIIREAADVANFAMMIADLARNTDKWMRQRRYEATDIPIEVGDRVCDSDTEAPGTILELDDRGFLVKWDDIGEIRYPMEDICWIRPLEKTDA
ncbi:hypothetical protein [Alicyclobacillus macrosporangiidus]|uniref:hypothetical protein n=1 Tax=Alicyclobacillus macrosporangiidus TaxID=392015 RepID=UPI001C313F6A|nr:hypothetical protein [Alicyclobacillus macrosporangiidus]